MSEYLLFRHLSNLGYPPFAVSLAVDVLQGRHRADDDDQADDDAPAPCDNPAWAERRTLTEPETFEPCEADEEWVAGLPSDEDLEAMARHAAWLDHLEGTARVTDADVIA